MDVVLAVALVLLTVAAMPWVWRRTRRSLGADGAAFVLGLGALFSNLLDPARKAATEERDKRRDASMAERDHSGQRNP